jgi:hypothetical protein
MEKKKEVLNAYYDKIQSLDYLSPTWTYDEAEDVDTELLENPDWQYQIYDERSDAYLSITEMVASDLHSYVRTHIAAYMSAVALVTPPADDTSMEELVSELDAAVAETITSHAVKNSAYCRRLAVWLSSMDLTAGKLGITSESSDTEIVARMLEFFNTICDEYMKYAPGPWRESTLIEALRGACMLLSLHNIVVKCTLCFKQEYFSQFSNEKSPAIWNPEK